MNRAIHLVGRLAAACHTIHEAVNGTCETGTVSLKNSNPYLAIQVRNLFFKTRYDFYLIDNRIHHIQRLVHVIDHSRR